MSGAVEPVDELDATATGNPGKLLRGDHRKDCCKDPANLTRTVVDEDRCYDTCGVCGCRHFRMKVDPLRFAEIAAGKK